MNIGSDAAIKTGSKDVVIGLAPKITLGVVYIPKNKVKDKVILESKEN